MHYIINLYDNNREILKNVMGTFLIKGGAVIVSFLTLPAYLDFFRDNTVLGIWYTILSIINWVLIFDLGLGNGLRNKLPLLIAEDKKKDIRKYISSTYILMTILVIFIGSILYIVIPFIPWNILLNVKESLISSNILTSAVRIVLLGVLLQFVLKIVTSILYAMQKSALVNLLALISNVLILVALKLMPSFNLETNLIIMSWINVVAMNLPFLIATLILFLGALKEIRPSINFYVHDYAFEVLKIGGILLWLQLIYLIVSAMNEALISRLVSPEAVVEYQVYFKIYNSISEIFILGLTPVWSAVTKAAAEKRILWIQKLYRLLLFLPLGLILFESIVSFFLQDIVNLWLGKESIKINYVYVIIFILSNAIFLLHNVNTSVGNGLSFFKTQMIWMTVAAVLMIPCSIFFVNLTGSWIGVVFAGAISILPFEIVQPFGLKRYLQNLIGWDNAI